MNLKFKAVDKQNWEECVKLSVSDKQKNYVAANWYSILQSKFIDELFPLCIYDGEKMVGFLMYGFDPDTKRLEMNRLMIDQKSQGKGYGKKAIAMLLDIIIEKYGKVEFYTSIEPENVIAQKLYESFGFIKTGEIMWDEEVMMIQL